jgi:hypothetical protein
VNSTALSATTMDGSMTGEITYKVGGGHCKTRGGGDYCIMLVVMLKDMKRSSAGCACCLAHVFVCRIAPLRTCCDTCSMSNLHSKER